MIRCPDWQRLLEHRFDPQVDEPEDWSAGLSHLEGCVECRLEAYGTDPTLALLDFPPVEVSADEVRRVKQAVMTLRQGLAIAEQDSSAELVDAAGRWRQWKLSPRKLGRWKVAAAVALASGLGLAGLSTKGIFDGFVPVTPDEATALHVPTSNAFPGSQSDDGTLVPQVRETGVLPAAWQAAPIVEEVGSPAARVYSYPQEETDTMTLVMIIDPEIEV